jgi:hypothetical protein
VDYEGLDSIGICNFFVASAAFDFVRAAVVAQSLVQREGIGARAGAWLLLDTDNKPQDQQGWKFVQDLEKGYTVSFEDPEQPGVREVWELRLFRVNGQLFADVVQLTSKFKDTDLVENFIPGHMVGTVKLETDKMSMRFLDDEWTAKAVKANAALINHAMVQNSAVLTAGTAELREFALAHAGDDKAFALNFNFVRKK